LYDALHGRVTDHHRFLLKLHLGQWDRLDAAIRDIDREVDGRIELGAQRRSNLGRFWLAGSGLLRFARNDTCNDPDMVITKEETFDPAPPEVCRAASGDVIRSCASDGWAREHFPQLGRARVNR
jgi:hypothetical protein